MLLYHFWAYTQKDIPQGHVLNYVDSSYTHNSQKLEIAQMSLNWRMDKENVVYLHNEVLISY